MANATIKERLTNVVNVVKIAVTGKDLSGQKNSIVANTKSNVVNKSLEAVANHPFITAGVAAAGITAIRYAPQIAAAVSTKTGSAAVVKTSATIAGSSIKPIIIGAAGGFIAANLIGSSGGATTKADQTITPTFTPTQTTTTNTTADNRQFINTTTKNQTFGSNSPIYTPISTTATQTPSQSVDVIPSAIQDTSGSQDATASGGSNLGIILLAVGALYLLSSKN